MAKRTRQDYLLGGLLVLGLVALVLVGGKVKLPFDIVGGGFTPLAISQVSLQSNSADFAGDAILAYGSAQGGGETLQGSLSPADISSATGKTYAQGFTIKVALNSPSCNVNYHDSSNTFVELKPHAGECYQVACGTNYAPGAVCPANNQFYYDNGLACLGDVPHKYVSYDATQYSVETLDTFSAYSYTSTFTLTYDDGSSYVGVLNPNQNTVVFKDASGNLIAQVRWTGNLVGQVTCSQPFSEVAILKKSGSTTPQLVSAPTYNAWYAQVGALKDSANGFAGHSASYYLNYLALSQQVLTNSYSLSQPCVFDLTNNRLQCTPQSSPIYPTFTILVKADTLKPVINVGMPSVQLVNLDHAVFARDVSAFLASVKNVGTADASFDVKFVCIGAANVNSTASTRIQVAKGATGVANVTGTFQLAGNYSCSMIASDVTDSSRESVFAFSYSLLNPLPPSSFECSVGQVDYQDKVCPWLNKVVFTSNGTNPDGSTRFAVDSVTLIKPACLAGNVCEKFTDSGLTYYYAYGQEITVPYANGTIPDVPTATPSPSPVGSTAVPGGSGGGGGGGGIAAPVSSPAAQPSVSAQPESPGVPTGTTTGALSNNVYLALGLVAVAFLAWRGGYLKRFGVK